jgi:hypothetical protein
VRVRFPSPAPHAKNVAAVGVRELHSLLSAVLGPLQSGVHDPWAIYGPHTGHTRATDCNVSTALPAVSPRFQLEPSRSRCPPRSAAVDNSLQCRRVLPAPLGLRIQRRAPNPPSDRLLTLRCARPATTMATQNTLTTAPVAASRAIWRLRGAVTTWVHVPHERGSSAPAGDSLSPSVTISELTSHPKCTYRVCTP